MVQYQQQMIKQGIVFARDNGILWTIKQDY